MAADLTISLKSALYYLLAQIKNKKIELRADPSDDDVVSVIKKEIKCMCAHTQNVIKQMK